MTTFAQRVLAAKSLSPIPRDTLLSLRLMAGKAVRKTEFGKDMSSQIFAEESA